MMTRAVDLTPYGKLLRTFPQGLENGAPSPFPTDATATTTTGYSCCTQNRGEIEIRDARCEIPHPPGTSGCAALRPCGCAAIRLPRPPRCWMLDPGCWICHPPDRTCCHPERGASHQASDEVKDPPKQERRCDLIITRTSIGPIGSSLRRSEGIIRLVRHSRS